jgi:hypothetical protein
MKFPREGKQWKSSKPQSRVLKQTARNLYVEFPQFIETFSAGFFGKNWIVFHLGSASLIIEIIAWLHAQIKV